MAEGLPAIMLSMDIPGLVADSSNPSSGASSSSYDKETIPPSQLSFFSP
jgi:hypothetical protein